MPKLYTPQYRPELDGLRAICITAVVLNHAFPNLLPGGFLGVDIFFVISGFLMTKIITKSIEEKTFSFLEFYSRRILRIFPALLLILSITLIAGWTTFYVDELRHLMDLTSASAFFVTNWKLLFSMTSYFGYDAEFIPLLHLWSLAVEEQFYAVIPIFIFVMVKLRINLLAALWFIGLVSFYFAWGAYPQLAFYSTPLRLWEFAAGGSLALISPFLKRRNETALIGLIMILAGLIYPGQGDFLPGKLLTILGSLLIIGTESKTYTSRRILSSRILVAVGVSSFSIYLWHWSLLSFVRISTGGELSLFLKITLCICSYFFGWLTWKWIEVPFRKRGPVWPWVLAIFSLGIFCFYYSPSGKSQFFKIPETVRDCSSDPEIRSIGVVRCFTPVSKKPEILLIGDSHAFDKFLGFARKDKQNRWGVIAIDNCPPLLGLKDRRSDYCKNRVEKVLQWASTQQNVRTLVFSYWGEFYLKRRFHFDEENISPEENFLQGLRNSARFLLASGKSLVVLIDIPNFAKYGYDCLRNKKACESELTNVSYGVRTHRPMISELRKEFSTIRFFDPLAVFCSNNMCRFSEKEFFYYYDTDHLSHRGSEVYAEKFLSEMNL